VDQPPVVRLANDIAAQFAHQPMSVAAVAVAGHIHTFWDPRMRQQLLALEETGDPALDKRVRAAVSLLRRPSE
jgi:formate dehydrogenase subunit delta